MMIKQKEEGERTGKRELKERERERERERRMSVSDHKDIDL